MGMFRVIKAGYLTSIQDIGRYGYQKYGIPVSGAMDSNSLQLANLLVGNNRFEAALEISFVGPTILFESSMCFAVTGAQAPLMINGFDIEMNKTIYANKGDILEFLPLKTGCRMYMAVYGGIDVPKVMESKSTYLRGEFGGFEGRKINNGDVVAVKDTDNIELKVADKFIGVRNVPQDLLPAFSENNVVRVIMGPEIDRFTPEGINTFLNREYTISNHCDRMGYQLHGPVIKHVSSADIISSPINLGTIQVPAGGNPIIMMADRQTTGGYTRIATIISVDLPSIAQLRPDDIIKFKEISVEVAQELYKIQEGKIADLEDTFNHKSKKYERTNKSYMLSVNGKRYDFSLYPL